MTQHTMPRPRKVPEWTFGERLRKVRREVRLTQEAFSRRVGLNDRTLAAYETDFRAPGHRELMRIARTIEREFDYSSEWIVMGDGPTRPPTDGLPHLDSNQEHSGFSVTPIGSTSHRIFRRRLTTVAA